MVWAQNVGHFQRNELSTAVAVASLPRDITSKPTFHTLSSDTHPHSFSTFQVRSDLIHPHAGTQTHVDARTQTHVCAPHGWFPLAVPKLGAVGVCSFCCSLLPGHRLFACLLEHIQLSKVSHLQNNSVLQGREYCIRADILPQVDRARGCCCSERSCCSWRSSSTVRCVHLGTQENVKLSLLQSLLFLGSRRSKRHSQSQ